MVSHAAENRVSQTTAFLGYKTELFSFQNNPKNLDPSYRMGLDLWDCLRRVKLVLQQNVIGLICSHSRQGKTPSYSCMNIVQSNLESLN